MIHRIPWTLEELDADGCEVYGAELVLTVEVDEGQPLILAADPDDSQEGIPASCEINSVEIVSAILFDKESGRTCLTNKPHRLAAVRHWLDRSQFDTDQTILDQLLEQISEQECDAAEAAAEDEYERRRDR